MTDQEPTNAHLLEILTEVRDEFRREQQETRRELGDIKRRTNAIENARAEARSVYDQNWSDVKVRLERIEYQTTRTNGRVSIVESTVGDLGKLVAELREWKSYMSGVAASFSWWKPALATLVAAGALWLVSR